jgi:hypothetical protein
MKVHKFAIAIIAVLSVPLIAIAQEQDINTPEQNVESRQQGLEAPEPDVRAPDDPTAFSKERMEFEQMDSDKSGGVSAEEAEAAKLEGFSEADINLNEEISVHEYIYHTRTGKQAQ